MLPIVVKEILDISKWRLSQINNMRRAIQSALKQAKLQPGRDNYKRLNRKDNPTLFFLLDIFCFFKYHVTNVTKQVCCVHQIRLFVTNPGTKTDRNCGWWSYTHGKTCSQGVQEVHHFNHRPSDNRVSNLTYCSPEENLTFTAALTGWGKKFMGRCASKFGRSFAQNFKQTIIETAKALGLDTSDYSKLVSKVKKGLLGEIRKTQVGEELTHIQRIKQMFQRASV